MSARTMAIVLAWLAAAAGCTSEAPAINPAPRPQQQDASAPDGPVQTDAEAGAEAEAPREAGPVKRRIFERSAFGNLEHNGDLLLDPDFEWSTGWGQTGWVSVSDTGQESIDVLTGGLCHSGLRCARIEGDRVLFGRGTGATSSATKLSLWAKVSGSRCDVLNVYFVRAMTLAILQTARVVPVTEAPDADGWCLLEGTAPPQPESLDVYIELKPTPLVTWAVLDDAWMRAADGMSALTAERPEPVDEQTQARVASRLTALRKSRWYGRTPPGMGAR